MRAARLGQDSNGLIVEDTTEPDLRPGCAVVRVESVFMSPYMGSLVDGTGGFATPPRPFTPGMDAVGTVERVADGVHGISPGDRVYCDSYVEAVQADASGAYVFAGCFAISPGSEPLLARWPDGALAEKMVLPAENLTPVDAALERTSADTLCRLGWFGTAHAAFEKASFAPGQSVAVLGATGLLGVSAVLVALAMGADRVVAVGRTPARLAAFDGVDPRVEVASQPPGPDRPVDLVVSAASGNDGGMLEASLLGLARSGSLVLLASVAGEAPRIGGLVTGDLTVRGSLWFPRQTPSRLVRLVTGGLLPVDRICSHVYPLDDVDAAIARSAKGVDPFGQVVVRP